MRYERAALAWLERSFPRNYIPGPWLSFDDGERRRYCQPDALLMDVKKGEVIVVEVKLRHTQASWFQLEQLYIPVLRELLSGFAFSALEMCHWYDPGVYFPARPRLLEHPRFTGSRFGVFHWKPEG